MTGVGHSCDAVSFLILGASIRGSRAYSESGGESAGISTSINSPGQMVVEVGGDRSTIARRAAELTAVGC